MNLTIYSRNARLVHEAFPHVFGMILSCAKTQSEREGEMAIAAKDARAIGWRISATGQPYNYAEELEERRNE